MKRTTLNFVPLILISIQTLGQTNYFVSPSGNNSNAGTSTDQSWQTIQYAVGSVSAGDTINIMQGTYNEKINITVSGAPDNDITFRNYNNDIVILSGSTLPAYEYIMQIENQQHIRIKGLKFQNYQQLVAIGIIIINSSYIYIEENEFSDIDYSATA